VMEPPPPTDYAHRFIIWISPRVVPWIAPAAFCLIFFLLFFPWRSIPASVEAELAKLDPGNRALEGGQMGWSKVFSSAWLVFYFFFYFLATGLAIGSLLVTLKVVPQPQQLKPLMPWRPVIVGGVAALAFLFLLFGALGEDLATFWFGLTLYVHFIALVGLALEFCLDVRGPNSPLPRIDIVW